MFSTLKKTGLTAVPRILVQKQQRTFASRAIYVANLSEDTTEDTLLEEFGKYGSINGLRMNVTNNQYRYAHIYYGAGETPKSEANEFLYMHDHRPTLEESREVEQAAKDAEEMSRGMTLDGNRLVVRTAVYSSTQANKQLTNAKNKVKDDVFMSGFEQGFRKGYQQGLREGSNADSSSSSSYN